MNNKLKLTELLEQVKDIDTQIENLEDFREQLYKRVDQILSEEESDIISLSTND